MESEVQRLNEQIVGLDSKATQGKLTLAAAEVEFRQLIVLAFNRGVITRRQYWYLKFEWGTHRQLVETGVNPESAHDIFIRRVNDRTMDVVAA